MINDSALRWRMDGGGEAVIHPFILVCMAWEYPSANFLWDHIQSANLLALHHPPSATLSCTLLALHFDRQSENSTVLHFFPERWLLRICYKCISVAVDDGGRWQQKGKGQWKEFSGHATKNPLRAIPKIEQMYRFRFIFLFSSINNRQGWPPL